MSEGSISDLYRRTEQNARDTAVAITRINEHEKHCTEKHEAVLKEQKRTNVKVEETNGKLDRFIDNHNRWMKGILASIILTCVTIIVTLLVAQS